MRVIEIGCETYRNYSESKSGLVFQYAVPPFEGMAYGKDWIPQMKYLVLGAFLTGGAALVAVSAAEPPSSEPPVYRPLTSDLMNEVIQPRHIKLWQAGKNADWDYAEYARRNLQGAFRRWSSAIPDYKGQKTADLAEAFTAEPLAQLEAAIKAKDVAAFKTAYGTLTDGCNNCHQSTDHKMVVIKVPAADAFPDQDFTAR